MNDHPLQRNDNSVEVKPTALPNARGHVSSSSTPHLAASSTQEFLDIMKENLMNSECPNECSCYHPPRTYPPWESNLHNQQLDGMHLENMKSVIARRQSGRSQVPDDHLCYKDDEDINEIRRKIANKEKESRDLDELQEDFKKRQLAFQALLMERKMSRNCSKNGTHGMSS